MIRLKKRTGQQVSRSLTDNQLFMKTIRGVFTVIIFLSCGCSLLGQHFSYSNKMYAIDIENDTKTDMKIHENYISFKPYLFEFNIRVNQYDSIDQHSGQRLFRFTFDTASIFLIDISKEMFFEFDSFTTEAKLLSSGKLQEKKYGTQFSEKKQLEADTFLKKSLLKDTTLWDKKLFYYSSVQKNLQNADSVITHVFFIEKPHFVSFHDIPNRLMKDELYSMVGFSVHLLDKHQKVTNELEKLRDLNRFEEEICVKMIDSMLASTKSKSPD